MIQVKAGSSAVQRNPAKVVVMKQVIHKITAGILSLIAGVSLTALGEGEAAAQSARNSDEHDDAQKAVQRGEIKSYAEIRRIVENKLGGRVVDLKLRRTNRGWQYFLRVSRNDGRVVATVVDARTGKIITTN